MVRYDFNWQFTFKCDAKDETLLKTDWMGQKGK